MDYSQITKHLLLDKYIINEQKKDSCYSLLTLGKPWTYFMQGLGYKVLQSIITYYKNLLSLSYPLQYGKKLLNRKVNSNLSIAR